MELSLVKESEALTMNRTTMLGVVDLWKQGLLTDFTIKIDDHQFKAHRVVLASGSDYFRAMLAGNMANTETDTVQLTMGVSVTAMEILIQFIYTNEIRLTEINVGEVLSAAMYLQMPKAIQKCTTFIVDRLDEENCLESLSVFKSYSLARGIELTRNYIKRNLNRVVKETYVSRLTEDDMLLLVEFWQHSEGELFNIILRWLNWNYYGLQDYWYELLSQVRYCLMPREDIEKIVFLLNNGLGRFDRFWEWLDVYYYQARNKYHCLPTHRRVLDSSEPTQFRTDPVICVFSRGVVEIRGYSHESQNLAQWCEVPLLQAPAICKRVYSVLEVNNFLITCMDSDGAQRWFIFNPRTSEWSNMAGMPTLREGFALVHHGGYLYALGGALLQEPGVLTDVIERYNFYDNNWTTFNKLPQALSDCAACFFKDKLYVSGGRGTPEGSGDNLLCDDDPSLTKVDCFDLPKQTWEKKADMLTTRSKHLMQVMTLDGEDTMCVIDHDANIERYDPARNQWMNYTYSVSQGIPPTLYLDNTLIAKGNSVYMLDVYRPQLPRNQPDGGVVLTFPKDDSTDEVSVVYLPWFPIPRGQLQALLLNDIGPPFPICAVLSLPSKSQFF